MYYLLFKYDLRFENGIQGWESRDAAEKALNEGTQGCWDCTVCTLCFFQTLYFNSLAFILHGHSKSSSYMVSI